MAEDISDADLKQRLLSICETWDFGFVLRVAGTRGQDVRFAASSENVLETTPSPYRAVLFPSHEAAETCRRTFQALAPVDVEERPLKVFSVCPAKEALDAWQGPAPRRKSYRHAHFRV